MRDTYALPDLNPSRFRPLKFKEIKDDYRASSKAKDVSFEDSLTPLYVEDNCSISCSMPTVPAA